MPRPQAKRDTIRGDSCQDAGLSVFTNFGDVARMRRRFPSYRSRLVAVGTLSREHGKVKPTPNRNCSSHQTWWAAKDVAPARLFTALDSPAPGESANA